MSSTRSEASSLRRPGSGHAGGTPARGQPAPAPRRSPILLPAIITGLSCGFLVAMVAVAVIRIGYPYELEWLEGAVLQSVSRILRGEPMYPPPSLAYAPLNYPPLFQLVSAGVMLLVGEGFHAMRAVSLTATLAILAMVFLFVRRVTGRIWAGALAAGLFAACYRVGGTWFDVGRLDMLSLALLLSGVLVLDTDRTKLRGPAMAAALVVLAFLAKPTAIVMFAPVLAWCAIEDRARGFRLAVMLGLGLAAAVVALDLMSGGGFSYYTFAVASQRPFDGRLAAQFPRDLARSMTPALLVIALAVTRSETRRPLRPLAMFIALSAGHLGATWVLRTHSGCFHNVLIPVHLSIMVLAAVAYSRLVAGVAAGVAVRARALLAGCALLWQLQVLAWDPRYHVPTAADRLEGDRLVESLKREQGRVLVSSHPYLLTLAGKPEHVHVQSFMDVVKGARGEHRERAQALLAELRDSLAAHAWDLLVLDTRDWLEDEARRAGYRPGGRVFRDPRVFWPATGMQTRPELVWVPGHLADTTAAGEWNGPNPGAR